MKTYHALIIVNAVIGAVLSSSGLLTSLVSSNSGQRAVGVALALLGVLQLAIANAVHVWKITTPPPPPTLGV